MTGLPAVYRPLNLHNEQPCDLGVHRHFRRFNAISRARLGFFPTFPFPVLWGGVCSLELAMEVEGFPSTPPWSLLSSCGFASKASIFGDTLDTIYIPSVLPLNLPQKFFWEEPGGWGLLFVWVFQGWVSPAALAREVFIWAEGGEGGNQRICNNPAATQVYSRGLHIGAQLWLFGSLSFSH